MAVSSKDSSNTSSSLPTGNVVGKSEEAQLVTFKLGTEEYGIDIMQVQEIIRLSEIVRVPKAPPFVEGVLHLREKILPVIDLAKRFGVSSGQRTDLSRIVVVNIKDNPVGLIVDSVCEVIRLPAGAVEPLPEMVTSADARFLRGIGRLNGRLIILVDLARVLSHDEMEQLEKVEGLDSQELKNRVGLPA